MTHKQIDLELRKTIDYKECWSTEIRAQWTVGLTDFYAVIVWDEVMNGIMYHRIARVYQGVIEFFDELGAK